MGKLHEGDRGERGPAAVKREVVSASAHLEVISQESFVWRLEGMSSSSSSTTSSGHTSSSNACVNCQRERTRTTHNTNSSNSNLIINHNNVCSVNHHNHGKSNGRRGKMGRRKQQQQHNTQQHYQVQTSTQQKSTTPTVKTNTPLVIHLRETLPGTIALQSRRRQSSVEEQDSDVSRSTDEDQSSTSSGSSSSGRSGGGKRRGARGGPVAHHMTSTQYRNSPSSARGRGRPAPELAFSHIYGDVESIPEFVPKSHYPYQSQFHHHHHHHFYPHYPQTWPLQASYYHPSYVVSPLATSDLLPREKVSYQNFCSMNQKVKEKSRKNLSALISVIEKAHRKEPAQDIEPNLSQNSVSGAKLSGSVLNNVSSSSSPSRPFNDAGLKRRNMAECENVELICNDLSASRSSTPAHSTAGGSEDQRCAMSDSPCTTTDESDMSDKASVASSSDTLSEDLAGELPTLDGGEMSHGELQQLAQYTTGVPLMRYDPSVPHHQSTCPQCAAAWYSHSQAYDMRSHFYQPRGLMHSHFQNKSSASTPRTSISSDSDVSSDVEDSSSTSSSESSAASPGHDLTSKLEQHHSETNGISGNTETAIQDGANKSSGKMSTSHSNKSSVKVVSRNPHVKIGTGNTSVPTCPVSSSTVTVSSNKGYGVKPTNSGVRVSGSTRQLWDIDVWPASRRRASRSHAGQYHHRFSQHPHYHYMDHFHGGPAFSDSVYMDLTGLDVTIEVTYHNQPEHSRQVFSHMSSRLGSEHSSESNRRYLGQDSRRQSDLDSGVSTAWPYPVHSLFQALYSPTVTAPVQGIQLPLHFNNTVFYPLKADSSPPVQLKKYEMSIPPLRPWIRIGGPDKDVPSAVFSTMCYNVLCDKLCTKTMYGYCPTWALSWDYRKKGIMRDILRGNADLITLQEVETEQYHSLFYPKLSQQGYDGIFLPKSRVRTMNLDKEKKAVDGCAIFFRKSKFEKVNEYHVEFNQLATREGASNTDTDMINRVSTKDNIAIVAVLRTKAGAYENSPVPAPKGLSQLLMVSTAHIHWDPALPDVKLVQTMMLVEELQKFVREASMQFRPNAPPPSMDAADLCNSMPLILCGDFNSLPDSGVYEYLSKGRLDTLHQDFEGQNYQVFMKDRHDNGVISHNFKLTSAYKDVIPFTNYTFDFKGIIDYVFYSDAHLRLHGVMGLQDEEWFRANKIVGCPHPYVPSDHFPLFAEFSLPAQASHPALSQGSSQGILPSNLQHRGPR